MAVTALAGALGTVGLQSLPAHAATAVVWNGFFTPTNWSNCNNWFDQATPGIHRCPTSSDLLVFDGSVSGNSSTIDPGFDFLPGGGTVGSISTINGYSGTATMSPGAGLTVNGNMQLNGGLFNVANGTLFVGGGLSLQGGNLAAGTLKLSGGLDNGTGGSAFDDVGTVTFQGALSQTVRSNGGSYNNIAHLGAPMSLADDLSASGKIDNQSGTLDLATHTASAGSFQQESPAILATTLAPTPGHLVVNGAATLAGSLSPSLQSPAPLKGSTFDVIHHTAGATSGAFSGKPEGSVFAIGTSNFGITYQGPPTGQDVVLTTTWTTLAGPGGDNFWFGASCPRNPDGTVAACFMVGDGSDAASPPGMTTGKVYRGTLGANGFTPTAWTDVTPAGYTGTMLAISCIDGGTAGAPSLSCFAVGASGALVHCSAPPDNLCNAASDWSATTLTAAAGRHLYSVSCASATMCAAVGSDDLILVNFNAGTDPTFGWTQANLSSIPDSGPGFTGAPGLVAVNCPTAARCYAGGSGGHMFVGQADSAVPWTPSTALPVPAGTYVNGLGCANLNSAPGTSSSQPCFAGTDGGMFSTADGGASWQAVSGAPGSAYALACTDVDCSAGGAAANLASGSGVSGWSADPLPSTSEVDGMTCSRNGSASFCWAMGHNLLLGRDPRAHVKAQTRCAHSRRLVSCRP